jgi:hypothetical protein
MHVCDDDSDIQGPAENQTPVVNAGSEYSLRGAVKELQN